MYTNKIGKFRFELDTTTNRIMVYREGGGIDAIAFITVKPGITEKSFHYEIMDWMIQTKNV